MTKASSNKMSTLQLYSTKTHKNSHPYSMKFEILLPQNVTIYTKLSILIFSSTITPVHSILLSLNNNTKILFWINNQNCLISYYNTYRNRNTFKNINIQKPITLGNLSVTSFIHLAVCLMTLPKPLPKRALHIVRSRASSFKWEYPLLFLRSSNSFLGLLPCLPVTSIPPFYLSFNNPL